MMSTRLFSFLFAMIAFARFAVAAEWVLADGADAGRVAPTAGDTVRFVFEGGERVFSIENAKAASLGATVYDAVSEEGSATFVATADGAFSAVFADTAKGGVWRISARDGAARFIYKAPSKGIAKCADTADHDHDADATGIETVKQLKKAVRKAAASSDEPQFREIGILFVYEKAAKDYINGGEGMKSFAQQAVEQMNKVLKNSSLEEYFQYKVSGVMAIEATQSSIMPAYYAALRATSNTPDEGWEGVHEKRRETGADVVAFLIKMGSDEGTVGVARAFTAAHIDDMAAYANGSGSTCVCAIESVEHEPEADAFQDLSHEVAHTLGCGHSRSEMTTVGPQSYDYSAGLHYWTNGDNQYARATVMAYRTSLQLDEDGNFVTNDAGAHYGFYALTVPYFSGSPALTDGTATYQIEAVNGSTSARCDNRQVLINTYKAASTWHQRIEFLGDKNFDARPCKVSLETLAQDRDYTIYYTTDGSEPTKSSSIYNGEFTVDADTVTVKAFAYDADKNISGGIYSATYNVNPFGKAIGDTAHAWRTDDGNTAWRISSGKDYVYNAAFSSGAKASCSTKTTIAGTGTLSFEYMLSKWANSITVKVNGKERFSAKADTSSAWEKGKVSLTEDANEVEFIYATTDADPFEEGRLRNVTLVAVEQTLTAPYKLNLEGEKTGLWNEAGWVDNADEAIITSHDWSLDGNVAATVAGSPSVRIIGDEAETVPANGAFVIEDSLALASLAVAEADIEISSFSNDAKVSIPVYDVASGASVAVAADISGGVQKNGAGTLVLKGYNGSLTHTGATQVNAGTLHLEGTHVCNNQYTVASGATLILDKPLTCERLWLYGTLVFADDDAKVSATSSNQSLLQGAKIQLLNPQGNKIALIAAGNLNDASYTLADTEGYALAVEGNTLYAVKDTRKAASEIPGSLANDLSLRQANVYLDELEQWAEVTDTPITITTTANFNNFKASFDIEILEDAPLGTIFSWNADSHDIRIVYTNVVTATAVWRNGSNGAISLAGTDTSSDGITSGAHKIDVTYNRNQGKGTQISVDGVQIFNSANMRFGSNNTTTMTLGGAATSAAVDVLAGLKVKNFKLVVYANAAFADINGTSGISFAVTDTSWLTANGYSANNTNVQTFLSQTGANGLPRWVSYALGIAVTDEPEIPVDIAFDGDGNVVITASGSLGIRSDIADRVGLDYVVESTADLGDWANAATTAMEDNSAKPPKPSAETGFYRVTATPVKK
ncbi:MAG: chitobiase/beta-hexosaminidase C-terminal domain-containing protein [Kiritimatiellae bacterium]|nr:chitobiase/beta-hexosaminidase C-terminal domain-containing protein [Kiritimatiellia bacterium]